MICDLCGHRAETLPWRVQEPGDPEARPLCDRCVSWMKKHGWLIAVPADEEKE